MAAYLLDSSALAKLYHDEPGSRTLERLCSAPDVRLYISRLTVVELASVMALKVRTRAISADQAEVLRERFDGDMADEDFFVIAMASEHYGAAVQFLRRFAVSHGLRTLDALQLAVAAEMYESGAIDEFVTADAVLCRAGTDLGIPVLNPASESGSEPIV